METGNTYKSRLQELSGSDYEIVENQPDIRGWEVIDENGKKTGEVDDLLFEEASRKVRYIVLDMDKNDYDYDARMILVPIGVATLHADDNIVIIPAINAVTLSSLPEYDKDNLTMEMEYKSKSIFSKTTMPAFDTSVSDFSEMETFYDQEHFDETTCIKIETAPDGDTPSQPDWLRKLDA